MLLTRCFSTLGCPERTLAETLSLAERGGFPAVELRALGGTVDLAAYLETHYGTPRRWAEALQRSPVKVAALNASLRLMSSNAAERTELVALAPWAQAAGVPWLRVFDGGAVAGAGELTIAAETLAWWRDQQREHQWTVGLLVETHDALCHTAILKKFLAAIPDVPLLWDAHHTWRKGGESLPETWAVLKSRTVHVHIKDSVAVPSPRHPFTYVLPGEGEFPMDELRQLLLESGYAGLVSLEWERLWHPYLPPLEAALAAAAEHQWWGKGQSR